MVVVPLRDSIHNWCSPQRKIHRMSLIQYMDYPLFTLVLLVAFQNSSTSAFHTPTKFTLIQHASNCKTKSCLIRSKHDNIVRIAQGEGGDREKMEDPSPGALNNGNNNYNNDNEGEKFTTPSKNILRARKEWKMSKHSPSV